MYFLTNMICDNLHGKNAKERAEIKAIEIVKLNFADRYEDLSYGISLEIREVSKIEGGIEVIARAWRGGQQLGFGDGTVEWERFKIFNPPILVSDLNGDIVKEITNDITGEIKQKKYRENPILAIKQTLSHTVKITGVNGNNIILGKVGSTVSTFYPDPNPETTSVDGHSVRTSDLSTFADLRAGVGTAADDSGTLITYGQLQAAANQDTYKEIRRSFFLFDTNTIPDADTITAGTFSFVVEAGNIGNGLTLSISLVESTIASNTAVVAADYQGTVNNTTKLASDITLASVTADGSTYNDFSLNAAGLAAISKTAITKFGGKIANDADNSAPVWVQNAVSYVNINSADLAGTSEDPKLVVTHSAASNTRSASGGASYGGFFMY